MNMTNDINEDNGHEGFQLDRSALLYVLEGVAAASQADQSQLLPARDWFSRCQDKVLIVGGMGTEGSGASGDQSHKDLEYCDIYEDALSLQKIESGSGYSQLVLVTIAVTFLRDKSRRGLAVTGSELSRAWRLIHVALTSASDRVGWKVSRSSQGFLAVPLCIFTTDGNIDELFRLHLWLPDGHRCHPDFRAHAHQTAAQSWILGGVSKNLAFAVEPVSSAAEATHAEYTLQWKDDRGEGPEYKLNQLSSTITNTQRWVRVSAPTAEVHIRDESYTVPYATFHATDVAPAALHATLFFFDAAHGFDRDAPVLGPKHAVSSTHVRDPVDIPVARIAAIADVLRSFEHRIATGRQHAARADLDAARREFHDALHLVVSHDMPNRDLYRQIALGSLGTTNRRRGSYYEAKEQLEEALKGIDPTSRRPELVDELAAVNRQLDAIEGATPNQSRQLEV